MKAIALIIASAFATASLNAEVTTSLIINEICNSNIDQWVDLSFNYGGWVEFYNPTSSAISITNWRISDDPDHLRKARITQSTSVPAHGYRVVWFDHYHPRYSPKTVDLKLDTDGGTIYVSDANGNLLLSQDYPAAVARCSWARTTNGGDTWQYCSNPSLGSSNEGHQYASERLAAPQVDRQSSTFSSGTISFSVNIPEGCTLKYTTDGSAPSLTSGITSSDGKFITSTTRLYRFRLFRDGYLPSEVVSCSFIRSTYNIDLPILSVTSTNKNFYSDSIGIFVKGRMNGRPGNGSADKCNWNMDWERPAVFEYFTSAGESLFSQEVGIERCGGWSRAWSPSSFKIRAGKQYEGQKTMDYPFFAEKPYLKHKALQIRNGGNDNNCRVKDAFLQQIVATSGIDVDYQAYQPVAHFVNGEWKGTINMREPNNKHYVYANYGLDDDEIDQFEMSPDSGYVQKCGDNQAWKLLLSTSKTASNATSYETIRGLLDIDEFCNYMAVQLYLRNWDWPQNNVKAWRPHRDEQGRFRFVLFDLDGFDGVSNPFTGFAGKQTYTFDWLYDLSRRYTKEIELVTLFLNLLNNAEFRKQFIDTFCIVTYSVFEPSRCKDIINALANRVAPTQALHSNSSPWNTANTLISSLSASRQSSLMSQLKSYNKMSLTTRAMLSTEIRADIDEARLTFNGLPIPMNFFKGKYFAPLSVGVSAPEGYDFVGWKQLTATSTTLMENNATWRYYDRGSLNNTGWQKTDYNDSEWSSGAAPLGYFTDGKRDYNTTLNYGTNANSKRPTYYFRTHVNLADEPLSNDIFELNYVVDDGAIIYVNGTEAARYNMPSGNVTYSTYATSYAPGNPDSGTLNLPVSLFHKGDNLIAVELHNNAANSTDVYWSASLKRITYEGSEIISTELTYDVPATSTTSIIACFTPSATQHTMAPVVINEVSAGNNVYVNEYQKKGDWIELYNTTDHEIDLAGMFLTDRLDKPQKYEISAAGTQASTLIPAHGYKVIWCDKLDTDRQLHASFKLDNDETTRQVMLTASDGTWADTLSYFQHDGNQSVGRYPDGNRNVYLMTRPSIDRSNELNSYCQAIAQPSPEAIERVLDDIVTDEYAVYDLSGRLVTRGKGAFSEARLATGIYIVRSGGNAVRVMIGN